MMPMPAVAPTPELPATPSDVDEAELSSSSLSSPGDNPLHRMTSKSRLREAFREFLDEYREGLEVLHNNNNNA